MLKTLTLTDYRSHTDTTLELSSGVNAFVAPNGSGKTNVIEAIQMLSMGRSWRVSTLSPLVREGATHGHIQAATDQSDAYHLTLTPRSRILRKNGSACTWRSHLGAVPTILFAPELQQLFTGSKSDRQKWLNRALCQTIPGYAAAVLTLEKLLKQKRAELQEDTPDLDLIRHYHTLMTPHIAALWQHRTAFIATLHQALPGVIQKLLGTTDDVQLQLVNPENILKDEMDILTALAQKLPLEQRARRCLFGPQRDDLVLIFRGHPCGETASRGQGRMLILGLQTCLLAYMEKTLGQRPILLLDDVFSELDQIRQGHLQHLCMQGQVFLTTTHDSHLAQFQVPVNYCRF